MESEAGARKLPKKVLVVDDEESIAELVQILLEDEGYEVLIVFNGKTALDKLAEGEKIDLIMSDIMMPIMDGWQLCQELQNDPAYRNIPFALMSAVSPVMPTGAGKDSSCKYDAFIKKPFELNDLCQLIHTLTTAAR